MGTMKKVLAVRKENLVHDILAKRAHQCCKLSFFSIFSSFLAVIFKFYMVMVI